MKTDEAHGRTQVQVESHKQEVPFVLQANAVLYPRAVMVHDQVIMLAVAAVVSPHWLQGLLLTLKALFLKILVAFQFFIAFVSVDEKISELFGKLPFLKGFQLHEPFFDFRRATRTLTSLHMDIHDAAYQIKPNESHNHKAVRRVALRQRQH